MKKIFLINGHRTGLIMKDLSNYWFGIPAITKYKFLLDSLVARNDVELYNLVTEEGSSMPHGLKSKYFSFIESKYILHKNGYGDKIKTIMYPYDVSPEDSVWSFVHVWDTSNILRELNSIHKVIMLNQFNFHSVQEIESVTKYATDFVFEANVFQPNGLIFQYKLPKDYKFHLLPYAVADRFADHNPFFKRKKKAIATGTLARCNNSMHINYFGTNLCHKMRKLIFDNKDNLKGYIDSFITPFYENSKMKNDGPNSSKIRHFYNLFYNLFVAKAGSQKKYFSFDIVKKYNEYQMAIVPEELVGAPAIGAFECMACGCAMIGIDSYMYRDLGLIPNKHYVSYDGTIDGLKNVICYYQQHQEELAQIAMEGHKFVLTNMKSDRLKKRFYEIFDLK